MSYITNAVIESAEITIERGFVLSAWLQLSYGGMGQGFGGYSLHLGKTSRHHEKSKTRNVAGIFIMRVMEIAEVEKWTALKGKTIRVEKTDEWGSILRIGHIVKDEWFDPKAEFGGKMSEQEIKTDGTCTTCNKPFWTCDHPIESPQTKEIGNKILKVINSKLDEVGGK